METNQQPNFEGDEMKLPTQSPDDSGANEIPTEHKGTIVVVLFVALAVVLAGLFYWNSQTSNLPAVVEVTPERPTAEMNQEPESQTATAQTESFTVLSTSDELADIDSDLESTNLESLDAEMNQIDAELEAAFEIQ